MHQKFFAAFFLFFVSTLTFADSNFTYQYRIPYTGGAALTITNNGAENARIAKIIFTTNASIAGNPWGTLWGWQSQFISKKNNDGIHTTYTLIEKPVTIIPPHQSAVLSYQFDANKNGGALFPYSLAMNPTTVNLEFENGQQIKVAIADACRDKACHDPGNGKRIMGYYPNWAYWRNPKFIADQLPYQKINTLAYAFSIFDKDGKVSLYDQDSDAVNIPIIAQARKRFPYLNASLSFGGWSWASTPPGWSCSTGASPAGPAACFSELAANETATNKFVANAVSSMVEVQFNGIDIDWEYPGVKDAENFIKLLQKLRTALNAQSEKDHTRYFLTIAVGAGIDKIQHLTAEQWQRVATLVDYINVMTYDFHGAWDQGQVGSDFMSAMQLDPEKDPTIKNPVLGKYNVVDAMQAYRDNGILPKQLLLGIPVYGRMMMIAGAGTSNGLYQPIVGTPPGEWDNAQSGATGMLNYNCIVDKTKCGNQFARPDLTLVDPTQNKFGQYAKTPWGYADNLFITYDDVQSTLYKTNWVKQNGYAGVMLWDLSGDFASDDNRSIVKTIFDSFNQK